MSRIGHVYYWSLLTDLLLVVDMDDRNHEVLLWKLYSLEDASGPYWFSENEMSHKDSMFVRFA